MKDHPIFCNIDKERASLIASTTVESLASSDLPTRLSEKEDLDFVFPILLYSLSLDNLEDTIKIFHGLFIDYESILDKASLNKYLVLFFQAVPVVFSSRSPNDQNLKKINDLVGAIFMKRGLFEKETWNEYGESLLCSIKNVVPISASNQKALKDVETLFFEFLNEADLVNYEISSIDNALRKLIQFCFSKNDDDIWILSSQQILDNFRKIYSLFISPKSDKATKRICYLKLKSIVKIGMELDAENSNHTPFLSNCFLILIKDAIEERKKSCPENSSFKSYFSSDIFIKLFPECVFIAMKDKMYIYDQIKYLFKIFSKQNINEYYLSLLPKYVYYLLSNETNFSIIFSIINYSSNFIAVHPQTFNQMLYIIIQSANALKHQDNDKIPIKNKQLWINTFANIYEFASIENNIELEHSILANITKFTTPNIFTKESCSEVKKNFLVHVLVLLITTGFEDIYGNKLLNLDEYIKKNRSDEIIEYNEISMYSLYTLIIAPYYNSFIKPTILEKLISIINESCLSINGTLNIDRPLILCFLLTLLEFCAKSYSYLSSERKLFFAIFDFLNAISETIGDEKIIQEMLEFLRNSILVPTITPNLAYLKMKEMTNLRYIVNDSNILTVGNLEGDKIGIIVRNKYGISSFDLKEIKRPKLDPAPEKENVKYIYRNILKLDDNYLPFKEYNEKVPKDIKENILSSLLSIGFINEKSKFTQYSESYIEPLLKKFDSYCERCVFPIRVSKIDFENINESKMFNTFLTHLGKSFNMAFCRFDFTIEDIQSNILLLFNETNKEIRITEAMKKQWKLIINISPQYKSLTSNILSYKLKVFLTSYVDHFISPISLKKWRIVSVQNLTKFIGIICFFYKANINENLNCEITDIIINNIHGRKIELENILNELSHERKETSESLLSYNE